MSKLTPSQRTIIDLSYGLNGNQPLSLIEIGYKVDMSREGVRQSRNKALKILKNLLKSSGLKLDVIN
jgi:RNA polymerase primary sigma factor